MYLFRDKDLTDRLILYILMMTGALSTFILVEILILGPLDFNSTIWIVTDIVVFLAFCFYYSNRFKKTIKYLFFSFSIMAISICMLELEIMKPNLFHIEDSPMNILKN